MLDPTVIQSLSFACQQLKERVKQTLLPAAQLSLPAEVVELLKLPQRNDKSLLKELLNCFVGTSKELTFTNSLYTLLGKYNALSPPTGNGKLKGISAAELQTIRKEVLKEVKAAKTQRKKAKAKEDQEEDDFIGVADDNAEEDEEIYECYRAAMVTGKPHPDPIVETSSLASIRPPRPTYKHHLQAIEQQGTLSDAQLETIVYANMRFQTTIDGGAAGGFFLGDGAGVGKGRQIAGLILEHKLTGGKRCLWISVSNDLRYDAVRDLGDVGADHIKVWPEGNTPIPKGKIEKNFRHGVLFVTYSLLVANAKSMGEETTNDPAAMQIDARIPAGSRLAQIVDWLKGDEAALIVLDECHKAKNLVASGGKSTQTGKAILKLQLNLPKARVLYSSATGASEPNNLAYMIRLGTCGFKSMTDLVKELDGSGLGSLEMFSMGLKATGSYVSRALSYKGAEFLIAKVKMDPEFRIMYNRSCEVWHLLSSVLSVMPKLGRKVKSQFYSAQQRFYRQMLMAAKVPETAKLALEAVADGMCVVIGLQSTGEANTTHVRELTGDVMEDFVSAPRQILLGFLDNHFPTSLPDMADTEMRRLHAQVHVALNYWKQLLPAKEQIRRDSFWAANQGRAQGTSTTSSGRLPPAEDSDDEVVMGEKLTLDEVIKKQNEDAKRTGCFIDLTSLDDDDEVRNAQIAIRQEEADELTREKQAAAERLKAEENSLSTEMEEAKRDVEDAHDDLMVARRAIQDCDRDAEEQSMGMDRRKRLRRCEGTANASAVTIAMEEASPAMKNTRKRTLVLSDDEDSDCQFEVTENSPAKRSRMLTSAIIVLDSSDEEEEEAARPDKHMARVTGGPSGGSEDSPDAQDDDVVCIVCTSASNGAEMLLCDSCDTAGAHHIGCLDPPLTSLPEGLWFCPDCILDQKDREEDIADQRGDNAEACITCGKAERQADMRRGTGCQIRAWHAECLDTVDMNGSNRNSSCKSCSRGCCKFTSGTKVNRGALLMKEKAAVRRLQQAEEHLKAVEQKSGRAMRAIGRRSSAHVQKTVQRPLAVDSSSHESSEAEAEDRECSDSDFEIADDLPAGGKERKPITAKDVKPIVPKQAQYRHAVAREALTDEWEDEIDAAPEVIRDQAEHPQLVKIQKMLVRLVQSLELPANPLDQLTELCGGSALVSEMTGRKGQLVRDENDGLVKYQNRRAEDSQKMVNMREKYAFMEGEKLIAIISEAASTGISLQADKRVSNQRRRCHLTLELPWSADKAIQQFGRSHRSNQTSAPTYRIIVTECAGEYRFAASAAKRLQSLGALLKGDRRALGAGQDLKEFDCDHKLGLVALKRIFDDFNGLSSAMPGIKVPEVPHLARSDPGKDYSRPTAFYDYLKPKMVQVGMMHAIGPQYGSTYYKEDPKVSQKVSLWLNRVLAMTLEDQELIFEYFSNTLDAVILAAKSRGEYDQGIMSIKASSVTVAKQSVIHTDSSSDAKTFHTVLKLDRGCSWESALQSRNDYIQDCRSKGRAPTAKSGFYIDKKKHGLEGKPYILLATEQSKLSRQSLRQFRIQRPNIGASPQLQEGELTDAYRRVSDAVAETTWRYWYNMSAQGCLHGSNCSRKRRGETCTWGQRMQPMHLISGAVLPVLKELYDVVHNSGYGRGKDGKKQNPKVLRAKLEDGSVIVGMEMHPGDARIFIEKFEQGDFANPVNDGWGTHMPDYSEDD